MTILDTFTFTVLLILFYFVKNYYDKYQTTSSLFKNLLEELEELNKSCNSYSNELTDLRTKIAIIKQAQSLKEETIKTLNQKVILQENSHIVKLELLAKDFQLKLKKEIKAAREDAISRSRSVIRGQATEHLAPFIMNDTNPKDCRFLGSPIDYIIFDGLSDVIDKTANEINEIKFIDVKTGNSSLNTAQRRIRDAISSKKVSFHIVNPDKVLLKQTSSTQENILDESN